MFSSDIKEINKGGKTEYVFMEGMSVYGRNECLWKECVFMEGMHVYGRNECYWKEWVTEHINRCIIYDDYVSYFSVCMTRCVQSLSLMSPAHSQ